MNKKITNYTASVNQFQKSCWYKNMFFVQPCNKCTWLILRILSVNFTLYCLKKTWEKIDAEQTTIVEASPFLVLEDEKETFWKN